MSDHKFTPGPWRPLVRSTGGNRWSISIWADKPLQQVGEAVSVNDATREQLEGNASLQAAAPAMLAALEECVGVLTEPGMMDVDEWKAWKRKAELQAQDAIKLALEGGEG